jgi:hypothetical protein
VKSSNRLVVRVAAPVGHAQLDQRVACALAIATGTRRIQHTADIGHRGLRLSGLRACRAAAFVQCQSGAGFARLQLPLAQGHRTVQPRQRVAHREQRTRTFAGPHQVVQGLGPLLGTLVVFGQLCAVFGCL